MKWRWIGLGIGILLLAACSAGVLSTSCTSSKAPAPPPSGEAGPVKTGAPGTGPSGVGGYRLCGPYVHKNLAIFLICGEDRIKGKQFLPLREAIEQKKVIVHETGNVNELAIENISEEEIYIQSGDIVKGGRQDRVLAYDFILPAKSGKMPISAFCVEQGRWNRRGKEASAHFASACDLAATKDLKIAAKHLSTVAGRGEAQGYVWKEVAKAQEKLGKSVGESVQAEESESSLQLTLEADKVRGSVKEYMEKLSRIIEGKPDVIGFAFAVNGELNSADIYASGVLFRKLWPRLLKASAVEALSEFQKDRKIETPDTRAVRAFMLAADEGKASEKDITKRTRMVTHETEENLLFETRDGAKKGVWIHRNYIKK
jgi:hypothetical protein